ncbi:MAG: hypothetical protein LBU27_09205 [Candidatus Peribacteria bacterium]|nr:hypothetical protein [Candidatus Peribacteria bacterium]
MPEKFDYINIGIDPAFSLKTVSDDIGVVVTGHLKIKVPHPEKPEKTMTKYKKFVLKVRALSGEEKDQIAFENVVIALYHNFNVRRIVIESNNGGETLARGLIRKGLAVDIVHATKDKVTRLKEHEGDLMEGYIFFVEGETEGLIQELVEFTGEEGGQDNLVDAFVRSLKEKKAEIFV